MLGQESCSAKGEQVIKKRKSHSDEEAQNICRTSFEFVFILLDFLARKNNNISDNQQVVSLKEKNTPVVSINRSQSTGGGAIKLAQDLREKYGVSVFAVTQPTDTSNPSGVLHQNIQLLFSKFDNQLRKQRAVAGMKEKFQKGEWVTRVPQGYDIIKINGVRSIVVNEEGAKLKKAFHWRALGMKNEEIIQRLNAMGVKMKCRTIDTIEE